MLRIIGIVLISFPTGLMTSARDFNPWNSWQFWAVGGAVLLGVSLLSPSTPQDNRS